MKSTIAHLLMAASSAALLFSSCSLAVEAGKESPIAPEEGVRLTITAAAETRTALGVDGESKYSYWCSGDELAVWAGAEIAGSAVKFTNSAADRAEAAFTGTLPAFEGSSTLFAIHPYSSIKNGPSVNFPANQTQPSASTFDPKSEVLLGKPLEISAGADGAAFAHMQFARVSAAIRVVLDGALPAGVSADEKVTKVVFSAGPEVLKANEPEGKVILSGNVPLNSDGTLADRWTAAANSVLVNTPADMTLGGLEALMNVAPAVIPEDTTIVFEIFTEDHYIRKEVKSHPAIDFPSGSFRTLKLAMDETVEVSGTPVIKSVTDLTEDTPWSGPDSEGKYSLTIKGRYEAEFASETNKVTYFFYFKTADINSGKQTTSTIFYSANDTEDFSYTIEGLSKNDKVEYIVVARFGETSANNVKTDWITVYVDPDPVENWTVAASWEPKATKTGIDSLKADTGTGAIVLKGAKKTKVNAGDIILTGIGKDEYVTMSAAISGYAPGSKVRFRFSKFYSDLVQSFIEGGTAEVPAFDIEWSSNGETWEGKESITDVPCPNITGGKAAREVTFEHAFSGAVSTVYFRLTYTVKGQSSRSIHLGNAYFETK